MPKQTGVNYGADLLLHSVGDNPSQRQGPITGFNYDTVPRTQERPLVGAQDVRSYLEWLGQGGGLQNLNALGQGLFGPQGRQTVSDIARNVQGPVQPLGLGMGGPNEMMSHAMDFLNPMSMVGGILGTLADDPIKRLSSRISDIQGRREKAAIEFMEGGQKDFDLLRRIRNMDTKMRDADETLQRVKRENAPPVQPIEETYKGHHEAPMRDSGSPGNDLSNTYPDDIYGYQGAQYYGHYGQNNPMDMRSISKIRAMRGNPEAKVEIYRAIPKDLTEGINPGDWVTINRSYAKEHGESTLGGDYKIIRKKVNAEDIFTNGDSIHEWGYDPN